jgi:RNaseH domain of pPIWI_RE/pPIWI_RE module N-terminal domain/MID domain of pPIWI_RE
MLITLNYRIPKTVLDSVLGTVTAYPLTAEFSEAWDQLPRQQDDERRQQPRYSWLATALCGATSQHVRLFGRHDLDPVEQHAGTTALLLTDAPIDYRLAIAVRTWERHINDGKDTLAALLPPPEPVRSLAAFITHRQGEVPLAPNWVFEAAAWQVMRRLTATSMRIDGRAPISWRMDTDGSLLAWDDLLSNRSGTAHAMARITARLVTHPGVEDPVLRFDAHLSRIAAHWAGVKHTWVERATAGVHILRLPVRHQRRNKDSPWSTHLRSYVPEILEACALEAITIPQELPPIPGAIRPQVSRNRSHSIGAGLGARFMLRLHEHVISGVPELEPLHHVPEPRLLRRRIKAFPDGLPADAVQPSGFQQVRLVCLYATVGARDRMLAQLRILASRMPMTLADGVHYPVNERVNVVLRHEPDLLAHGRYVNRNALLEQIADIDGDRETLVVAWLETAYGEDMTLERADDAKPHLRRLLGCREAPCQFLATEPDPDKLIERPAPERDHRAKAALHDVLRIAGILDNRIYDAVTKPKLGPLTRSAMLVGIHARRQQTKETDTPLVLTMVTIYADPNSPANWHILMHGDHRKEWLPIGPALAAFHAGHIGDPSHGRTAEKAAKTRDYVEDQLTKLLRDQPFDLPVVIFVDAQETRTIWPGLQNTNFGNGHLPGQTLASNGRDIAIVRCNNTDELGRPVTRGDAQYRPRDPRQPAAPGRSLYRLTDSTKNVWLFAGTSRTYDSKGGNTGARYTRWTLPPEIHKELRKPWHAYTGTEIAIIQPGTWNPLALAALTARLCDQPMSWDGRTRLPTPLHLAVTADKDHPDYRTSDTPAEDNSIDSYTEQDPEP